MNEQELLKNLAELPREIEPRNDPWKRIEARLQERNSDDSGESRPVAGLSARRWVPVAVAAAALFAVALVISPGNAPGPVAPEVAQAVEPVPAVPPPVILTGSEAEYRAAFHEFIAVGESREVLSPLAVEKIETGWADLRQVELALSDALARNPEDPFLNRRMLELRARQLGFLRQLAALDQNNRRLTI